MAGAGVAFAAEPRVRRFSIRYEARTARTATLWLPAPVTGMHQRISELKVAPADAAMHIGAQGNRILSTNSMAASLEYRVERREHGMTTGGGNAGDLSSYLRPDRLVPLDDRIRQWAREAAGGARTPLEQARAIYNHVVATVKYDKSGTGWGRGDIYYACEARRGNCTDFHAIFIGYCRALGIPARFVIGLPLPPGRREGTIDGYHCWAEFHTAATGWVPIDASEAAKDPSRREYFFGTLDEHRVELSRGRDLTLSPPQAGDPLNFFVFAYAEDGGKPVPVTTRVSFRNR